MTSMDSVETFARLATQSDGPQKKFLLIKNFSDLLPANRRELSCAELQSIIGDRLACEYPQ